MTIAPKARFGQAAEGAPKRQRSTATPAKPAPSFRTVLIPTVGWPTEATLPVGRKRPAKR